MGCTSMTNLVST